MNKKIRKLNGEKEELKRKNEEQEKEIAKLKEEKITMQKTLNEMRIEIEELRRERKKDKGERKFRLDKLFAINIATIL